MHGNFLICFKPNFRVKSPGSSRASSVASVKEAGMKVVCPNGERKNKGLFDGNSLLTNRKSAPVNQAPTAAGPLHQFFPIYLPLEVSFSKIIILIN